VSSSTFSKQTEPLRLQIKIGLLLALVSSFLFSLKPIIIKQAYGFGADSESVMLLRMWFALPFYLVMLYMVRSEIRRNLKYVPAFLGMGFFGYFLSSYLDLLALERISAQTERIILYAYPSLVILIKCLYDKTLPSKKTVFALVMVYAGILLFLPGELHIEGTALGLVLMAFCALTFALYVVWSKPLIEKCGTALFTAGAMIAAILFTQSHMLHMDVKPVFEYPPEVYIYVLVLAFFCTVIPSYTMSAAIARIGSEKSAIAGSTGPVFTSLLAVMLLGESFGIYHALGMALVIVGVWVLGRK